MGSNATARRTAPRRIPAIAAIGRCDGEPEDTRRPAFEDYCALNGFLFERGVDGREPRSGETGPALAESAVPVVGGESIPSVECRRRRLKKISMYSKTSLLSSAFDGQLRPWMGSLLSVAKKRVPAALV